MKERPILFSGPMIRALLAGTKTQTRRVVKGVPGDFRFDGYITESTGDTKNKFSWSPKTNFKYDISGGIRKKCPYGQPGDRLWVRENWRIGAWDSEEGAFAIDYVDGPRKEWVYPPDNQNPDVWGQYFSQSVADSEHKKIVPGGDGFYHWEPGQSPCRWRPSIHMPQWASRITLEITSVRVERLQDIRETDAKAEGVEPYLYGYRHYEDVCTFLVSPVASYRTLWQSISGFESWESNPWVWVVEFKRVQP